LPVGVRVVARAATTKDLNHVGLRLRPWSGRKCVGVAAHETGHQGGDRGEYGKRLSHGSFLLDSAIDGCLLIEASLHALSIIDRGRASAIQLGYLPPARMLIALPAIAVNVTTEIAACSIISILARRVSGSVSVGLNAKLVVNATNR